MDGGGVCPSDVNRHSGMLCVCIGDAFVRDLKDDGVKSKYIKKETQRKAASVILGKRFMLLRLQRC